MTFLSNAIFTIIIISTVDSNFKKYKQTCFTVVRSSGRKSVAFDHMWNDTTK